MEIVEDKRYQIMQAAIKRFSHFGIFKTSMSEIADDVALSKANLYYYFPDKWTLIESLVDLFVKDADEGIEKILEEFKGTEDRLIKIIDFQFDYINKYKMLFHDLQEFHSAEFKVRAIADKLFVRECELIERILREGENAGEIVTSDIQKTSKLYVTILKGLSHSYLCAGPNMTISLVDPEVLLEMTQARKEAVSLMLNGLIKR